MATKIRGSNFSPSATTTITSIVTENSVDSALVTNLIDSAYITARASTYDSDNFAGQLAAATTADLSEGSNLYYTTARFDSDFGDNTTSDLTEGSNLYYTTARFDSDFGDNTTSDLTEGSNLYYTNARADARIAAASITDLSDADQTVRTTDNVSFADVTLTGALNGPSTFYIDPAPVDSDAGLLVIRGDLQVDGTTTTVNSTTVSINDKNIVLADSAANASEADGAGITVNGASATIQYDAVADAWDFNKDIDVTGTVTADGLTIAGGTTDTVTNFTSTDTSSFVRFTDGTGSTYAGTTYQNGNGAFAVYTGGDTGGAGSHKSFTVDGGGDVALYDNTGSSQGFYWDASTQRLGLGETSPESTLTVRDSGAEIRLDDASNNPVFRFMEGGTSKGKIETTAGDMRFYAGGVLAANRHMTITSGGSVGIGTSSPNTPQAVNLHISGTSSAIRMSDTTNSLTGNLYASGGEFSILTSSSHPLVFKTSNSEAMRIDSSGNVGIGTSSPVSRLEVEDAGTSSSVILKVTADDQSPYGIVVGNDTYSTSDTDGLTLFVDNSGVSSVRARGTGSALRFATNGSERLRIDSSGNVGIGNSIPSSFNANANNLVVGSGSGSEGITIYGGNESNIFFADGTAGSDVYIGRIEYSHLQNAMKFYVNNSHAMRIDSSGNLLVGTTSLPTTLISATSGGGIALDPDSYSAWNREATSSTQAHLIFNQTGVDAQYLQFRKDGSEVGSIGTVNNFLNIGTGDTGLVFVSSDNSIRPFNTSTNSDSDNSIDLGYPSIRFKRGYFSATVFAAGVGGVSDENTYVNFPGSDVMQFFTGGSERARIDSSGNMGIGTSSPANKLQIVSTTTDPIAYFGKSQTGSASNGLIKLQSGRIPQDGSDTTGESGIIFAHSGGTGGTNFDATGGYIKSIRTSVHSVTANADSALVFATSKDNADTERLRITSTGNVGIGTTSPSNKLSVEASSNPAISVTETGAGAVILQGTGSGGRVYSNSGNKLLLGANGQNSHLIVDTGGNVGIGTISPSYKLHVSGDIYATGNVTAYSDIKLKENIKTIENAVDLVSKMRGVTFTRKDNRENGVGVIAQEMQKVLPQVVTEKDGVVGVAYGNIVGVLIEAMKEQQEQIEELKAQVEELKSN